MTRTRTPSYKCSDCNKTFSTIVGVMAHGTAKGHTVPFEESPFSVYPKARLGLVECHPCKRGFIDQETLSKHVRSSPLHSPSFCEQCQKWLKDEFMLKEHLRASPAHRRVTYVPVASRDKLRCSICERRFKTQRGLNDHRASPVVHRPRTIKCFACIKMFKSPSGLAQHVESNCKGLPVNRHQVTSVVQTLDIVPAISLRPAMEDTTAVVPRQLVTYHATESAFNGNGYECHICNKVFHTLSSLDRHSNSPAHDDEEFQCPKCNKKFTLTSGLVSHLESGSCGLSGIQDVEKRFEERTDQFSRLLMLK